MSGIGGLTKRLYTGAGSLGSSGSRRITISTKINMEHTITTEQIKALASISNSTEVWLKHAFPTAFSTIMDRVKTVEDARDLVSQDDCYQNGSLQMHFTRFNAFINASLVHTALCEGWVFEPKNTGESFRVHIVGGGIAYHLPFWFETEAKRDYFQTQFADLLKTIITGKP